MLALSRSHCRGRQLDRARRSRGPDSPGVPGAHADLADVPGLADATDVAGGDSHVCAVRRGGAIACFGANTFGALGDGTTMSSTAPVTGPVGPYTQITAGDLHTCALLADGSIEATTFVTR